MSTGQKPRWREHFPCMKTRGRDRGRGLYITRYDSNGLPIWPPGPVATELRPHYGSYPHPRSGRRSG